MWWAVAVWWCAAAAAGAAAAAEAAAEAGAEASNATGRHLFYRDARVGGGDTRRVFGGREGTWGAACMLLDRYYSSRCSGAVLAPRWALTAAHCVMPHLAYVKYDLGPGAAAGQVAPVAYLYRHPGFRVVEQDEGRGPDVTLLHHDVGLVRTQADMRLAAPPPRSPLDGMRLYDADYLRDKEVQVLGFGRTESGSGERLFEARLAVTACERAAWLHCICGRAAAGRGAAGVCSGDSGGPVLHRGALVAVTSMGPAECGAAGGRRGAERGTSVFVLLQRYAPLVEATLADADSALAMSPVARSAAAFARRSAYSGKILLTVSIAIISQPCPDSGHFDLNK